MMASAAQTIETMLGVSARQAGSTMAVAKLVEAGLSVATIDRLAKAVAPDDPTLKYRFVSKPTLARSRKNRQRLSKDEGNRVARVARVYEMAMAIFHAEAKLRDSRCRRFGAGTDLLPDRRSGWPLPDLR